MADYIDRQALDVVAFTDRDGTFSDGIQWLLEYIDALPSTDVVKVVRCKDCKHKYETLGISLTWFSCEIWHDAVEDDDFCSKAERRTDE